MERGSEASNLRPFRWGRNARPPRRIYSRMSAHIESRNPLKIILNTHPAYERVGV
jgi:hypothetical protein